VWAIGWANPRQRTLQERENLLGRTGGEGSEVNKGSRHATYHKDFQKQVAKKKRSSLLPDREKEWIP